MKKNGDFCSRKLVAKLMQNNGIQAKQRKKWKRNSSLRSKLARIAPNRINRDFSAALPNQKWVADITCIKTTQGWLYLAAIMDIFSRKIVGLSMSDQADTQLITNAYNQAICHRGPQAGLVLHSDRGAQYTSHEYERIADLNGALLSMSSKGNCYDNAAMESFFHTLKTEHVYFYKYQTRKEAANSIFEYIEVFYNRQRIHSTLNYVSPLEFEQQFESSRVKLALPAIEAKV